MSNKERPWPKRITKKYNDRCGYLDSLNSNELDQQHDNTIGILVNMIKESGKWIIR
jgi:hypothetical protein